jgi:hypothetical protein
MSKIVAAEEQPWKLYKKSKKVNQRRTTRACLPYAGPLRL